MIGFSAAGIVSSLMMREAPIKIRMDETWGLEVEGGRSDVREDIGVAGHSQVLGECL